MEIEQKRRENGDRTREEKMEIDEHTEETNSKHHLPWG